MKDICGQEVENGYFEDHRWELVYKLRDQDKHVEADTVVNEIRYDWGL